MIWDRSDLKCPSKNTSYGETSCSIFLWKTSAWQEHGIARETGTTCASSQGGDKSRCLAKAKMRLVLNERAVSVKQRPKSSLECPSVNHQQLAAYAVEIASDHTAELKFQRFSSPKFEQFSINIAYKTAQAKYRVTAYFISWRQTDGIDGQLGR